MLCVFYTKCHGFWVWLCKSLTRPYFFALHWFDTGESFKDSKPILITTVHDDGTRCFLKGLSIPWYKTTAASLLVFLFIFDLKCFSRSQKIQSLKETLLMTRSQWFKLTSTIISYWHANTIQTNFKEHIYHWYLQRQRQPLLWYP